MLQIHLNATKIVSVIEKEINQTKNSIKPVSLVRKPIFFITNMGEKTVKNHVGRYGLLPKPRHEYIQLLHPYKETRTKDIYSQLKIISSTTRKHSYKNFTIFVAYK